MHFIRDEKLARKYLDYPAVSIEARGMESKWSLLKLSAVAEKLVSGNLLQ